MVPLLRQNNLKFSCCTLPVEINKMTACLMYGAGDPAGNEVSKGAVREQNIGHTN